MTRVRDSPPLLPSRPGEEDMTDDAIDTVALGRWLGNALDAQALDVEIDGRPSGGFSAETHLVTARGSDGARRRFVVRVETPEPAVYPAQSDREMPEIEIQFRVMDSLARCTSVPVAPLIGYEPDDAVLGRPFFVMGHVDGVVPIESPPYTVEGFFTGLSPDERTSMIDAGLARLADVHRVDVDTLDLDWLVPANTVADSQRLVDLWSTFGETELRGREHPLLERGWQLIRAELPEDSSIGLCWGDPRPGNIIWRDTDAACLTDFEAACIGPPEFDLGWWLMFDRTMHELAGVDRLPGDPQRQEQRERYYAHAGRPALDTTAHEIFAAARYCVIVVRVMNRLEQRGLLPADSTVWRDNPASACLELLLDERW